MTKPHAIPFLYTLNFYNMTKHFFRQTSTCTALNPLSPFSSLNNFKRNAIKIMSIVIRE